MQPPDPDAMVDPRIAQPKCAQFGMCDDVVPGVLEDLEIGVFNCNGEILAIEDRCSHDNGTLAEGELDPEACTVECPRHGSLFDLHTGKPMTLPAYVPVETFPVVVDGDLVKVEVE